MFLRLQHMCGRICACVGERLSGWEGGCLYGNVWPGAGQDSLIAHAYVFQLGQFDVAPKKTSASGKPLPSLVRGPI